MSIPVSTEFVVYGAFTASKQGKTGLTVTADIIKVTPVAVTVLHTAIALGVGTWTAHVGGEVGDGLYGVVISTTDDAAAEDTFAILKTTDGTVDAQWVYAFQRVGQENVNLIDAAVSTRAQPSDLTALATGAALTTAITTINAHTDASVAAATGGSGSLTLTPTAFAALAYTDVVSGATGTIGAIEANGVTAHGIAVTFYTDQGMTNPEAEGTTLSNGMLANSVKIDPGIWFVGFVLPGYGQQLVKVTIA